MSTRTSVPSGADPVGRAVPGVGAKSRAGDSALIRTSIAWPRDLDLVLADREALAAGDPQLLADDVDAGDHLARPGARPAGGR